MTCITDPDLRLLINRLQTESQIQSPEIGAYFEKRAAEADFSRKSLDQDAHQFYVDKLVALEDDKACFCHLLCRTMGAKRIIEVGTSYGVSTLYLADALRANGGGVLIGTEHEPAKAAAARRNFSQAGLSSHD